MTNEELMEQFMAGDESVLTKLCNKNEGLIRSRAKEIAQTYNCIQYTRRGKYKAYTKHILNDLCGVGASPLWIVSAAGSMTEKRVC